MHRSSARTAAMRATALVAAAALGLSGLAACGSGSSSSGSASSGSGALTLGGFFPETGSMSFLGPDTVATFKLAVKDINAAGGVLGKDVNTAIADSSDADHADQNTAGVQSLLAKKPGAIIGPTSSSVSKNIYKQASGSKVPVISVGATSPSLSGIDPYFFRTIAPDGVQGAVMSNVIEQDGIQRLAIAVFNDEYGTGLRKVIVNSLADSNVNVVYGETETFDPTETNFSSLVTTLKASNPDAILVIAFDQTKALVKEMISQGIDTNKLYLTDGNAQDYSGDFDPGVLKGDAATIPGAEASDEFQKRIKAIDSSVKNFTYAAETYDAVVLSALAAQKGGAVDGATIKDNLPAVSGADGGTKCKSYKECLALLKGGKSIQYQGLTGIGPFNKDHDPSSANIGVYKFDGDNKPVFDHLQSGKVA
ncbi:ABC transporter substrate-binding protein [Bifidobacterium apri]|uniref:ABC transporter substrate-binding protein n=1 Tax=Bifidobacterium apri TaxID=1769423 RepID=UPI003996AD57